MNNGAALLAGAQILPNCGALHEEHEHFTTQRTALALYDPQCPRVLRKIYSPSHFLQVAKDSRAPTRTEKEVLKLKKKVADIEKIEKKLAAGEKIDSLQLPKLEKKNEVL